MGFGAGFLGGFGQGLQNATQMALLKQAMLGGAGGAGAATPPPDPTAMGLPQNQMVGTADDQMIPQQFLQQPGLLDSLKSRLMGMFGGR